MKAQNPIRWLFALFELNLIQTGELKHKLIVKTIMNANTIASAV